MEMLAAQPVDVLVLDMGLPGIPGVEVVKMLRFATQTATLPILLMTGSGTDRSVIEGLEAGADDFLAKPVRLDELVARVRAHLRSRAAWARRGRGGAPCARQRRGGPPGIWRSRPIPKPRPRRSSTSSPAHGQLVRGGAPADVEGIASSHWRATPPGRRRSGAGRRPTRGAPGSSDAQARKGPWVSRPKREETEPTTARSGGRPRADRRGADLRRRRGTSSACC